MAAATNGTAGNKRPGSALAKGPCFLGCAAILIVLTGCPSFQPVLTVSPGALSFGSAATRESLAILNVGHGTLKWQAAEVVWDGATQEWLEQDIEWLSIDPEKLAGSVSAETDRVFLSADRDGLSAGAYSGTGIRVTSNGGTAVIPVSIIVQGTTGGDEPDADGLVVSPTAVTINGLDDTATFTVANEGDALVHWYTEVTINATDVPDDTPIQVTVDPTSAITTVGDTTTATVSVSDPTDFDTTYLNYIVAIRDQADGGLIAEVIVTVDQIGPPVIAVDPAVLDYGTDGYQVWFLVANLGNVSSLLDFAVFTRTKNDDGTYTYTPFDVDADALIATIDAPDGMLDVESDILTSTDQSWQYARDVVVTISRDGIKEDLEYRDLWIGAVAGYDESGNPIIDTDVTPQEVQVRVEAAATLEGALNRSRPPSLMRFVFMLRDKRGIAIDASDDLIRSQIEFSIQEDDAALEPYESSQFVTGPENITCNLVLLLDYTGSMYNAGVDDTDNKLEQGEAISQMVQAAKQFILDVPDTYKIAIMEYHDRQQSDNVIHGFDTNKAALIESLDKFSLPAAEHGASEIYDVLYRACDALVDEDPADLLPFDEADVRSVVFVTDGWDTSSTNTLDEVVTYAQKSRVRLYPIGFSGRASSSINDSAMIRLASDTGGHTYYASEVNDLTALLDTENSLSFNATTVDLSMGKATLTLRNAGSSTITWQAIENIDWLAVYPATGSIPPLHRDSDGVIDETGVREVTVTLASGFPEGTYEGSITIQSDYGNATVNVSMTIDSSGALTDMSVIPRTTDAGRLWRELRGQVVLTYTSLFQEGTHPYYIESMFPDSAGDMVSAHFQKDAVYYAGDPRAGQLSLSTTGISSGTAEILLRADYVPRNITQFRLRFIIDVPEDLTPNLTGAERDTLLTKLNTALNNGAVTLTSDGLLDGWRLISSEGHGIFMAVTESDNYLTYASSGQMLKLTFDGLGANDAFTVGMRVDNTLYYSPASATQPSLTKYFLYPGGFLNPTGLLTVSSGSSIASPSLTIDGFTETFDPEATGAWDRDGDSWPDFDDINPDDVDAGDADGDGVPDLDDPAPNDFTIS